MPVNILPWPIPMPQPKPHVYIFMGLIASGKSTLAQGFATRHHLEYYNSDVERKKLAGIERTARGNGKFSKGIYTSEMTRLTYDELIAKGRAQIAQGRSVVLDGSYTKQVERKLLLDAFARTKARSIFILCEVSEQITRKRLQLRTLDKNAVSDGTFDIYALQKKGFEYPDELDSSGFMTIETDGDIEQLLTALESSRNIPPFSV